MCHSPSVASDMMPISTHLMVMATLRLLKRSATNPPAIENKMNGNANNMPTYGTSLLRCSSDKPMPTMRNVTRNLRTLSLNAFWNCVTNRHQKPRPPPLRAGATSSDAGG